MTIRLFFRICALAIAQMATPNFVFSQAQPENHHDKLLALVIGNSDYNEGHLSGPDNDSKDMATALQGIGFKISNSGKITNLHRNEMISVTEDFMDKVDKDTVAIVYYSGHGVEDVDNHKNYLVPIDASFDSGGDWTKRLVSLDEIIRRLGQREARTKLIILDACRNMPPALRYKSFGDSGGLAPVEVGPGTRIVYAAAPTKTALSALPGQRNSVFTAALLQAIKEKPASFDDLIANAASITINNTGHRQTPWATGDVIFSFKFSPQTATNPFSQPANGRLPRSVEVSRPSKSEPCKEVSEQIIENGVSTWTKVCAQ